MRWNNKYKKDPTYTLVHPGGQQQFNNSATARQIIKLIYAS
ncbi:MAG TPA: hypothetical protein VH396_05150 [Chitinophagaceae bacterium]